MEHKFVRYRLIDSKKIKNETYNKNFNLIYFFIGEIDSENSFYKEYSKEKINHEIYKRINGDYTKAEEDGGKALCKIIEYLNNCKTNGGSAIEYDHIISYISTISSQKISSVLYKLTMKELIIRILHNKKSYYSIADDFDKKIETICDKINKYIRAYNLMPYSDDDLYNEENGVNEAEGMIDGIIIDISKKNKIQDKEYDSSRMISDKKMLIDYLKNVVELESEIYSLKQRYIELGTMKQHYIGLYLIRDSYTVCLDFCDEISKMEEEIKINSNYGVKPTLDYFINKNAVSKPFFNRQKPVEPELKKSGLFNKKKIHQENEAIMLEYRNKLEKYNQAKNNYDISMKNYEEEMSKMKVKANEEYQTAIQQYEEKITKMDNEIKEKEKKKEELINNSEKAINDLLLDNKYYQKVKAIEYEMSFIEKCLEEPIKLKEEIYSYNIIYGKYRNFIAISSFIDYFMSGRCDSLEGSDGAYNLYEQETRTDIIINKMEVIIKKLDQIANNQYYMYNKLNEINDSLYNISGQLMVNNILQTIQVSELEKIIDKADKIAYNTEVTAYYAEKTSKYAKIMTYLNFLNLRV